MINSVDTTSLSCNTRNRRSTTVSVETDALPPPPSRTFIQAVLIWLCWPYLKLVSYGRQSRQGCQDTGNRTQYSERSLERYFRLL